MYHAHTQLEQDIVDLFDDPKLRVDAMRQFFKEAACNALNDDPDHPAHEKAALRFFDRWYRNLRQTIWTSAAEYALIDDGCPPREAKKEATTMYRNVYPTNNRNHKKEATNED